MDFVVIQKKIIRRQAIVPMLTDLHPVLQKIYANRGLEVSAELEYGFDQLLPYQSLKDIDKAIQLLTEALVQQKHILIIGDFDADGATSTAVAIRALRSFGAQKINYLVPNRFAFGYGLTPELVDVAKKEFNPELIVTVDNGIANHAGVASAKALGIDVIITDHHLAAETLPEADAIVNPNQPDDNFPSKHMAGVGVIFYVMLGLRRYLSEQGWFAKQAIPEPNMSRLLDIVALGTVADVVSLDHHNRILVSQGLRRIRAGHCAAGITALLEAGGKNQGNIVAADLGFIVAPRLNAAGRLDDMSLGIECLLTDDREHAKKTAQILDQLNDERRVIEQDMQEQALQFLKKYKPDEEQLPTGLCLYDQDWHQGVIGILASRIKDRLQRPVIAFALANDGELKGSARSIPGVHIRDALANLAVEFPELIIKFGGHAMAAGLTVPLKAFKAFSKAFDKVISSQVKESDLQHAYLTDGELNAADLTLDLAHLIREAGPWGQSFPEPLFDGVFDCVDQRLVGSKHLKMVVAKDGLMLDAIAFNVDINEWPNYRCHQVVMVYRLDVNEYRGKRKVQLIVEYVVPA